MYETLFNYSWKKGSPNQSKKGGTPTRDTNSQNSAEPCKPHSSAAHPRTTDTNPAWIEREDRGINRLTVHSRMGENIEERARLATRDRELWAATPGASVAREIALTLDQISQVRELRHELERNLLEAECDVDTELMQPQKQGDKARLRGRLAAIDTERRRLALTTQEQLMTLHQRLLGMLNQHGYLDDGN
jgi:hypothetical protein